MKSKIKKIKWHEIDTARFSVLKATEGGPGYSVLGDLKYAGIPCQKCYTPYVGNVAVEVPKKYGKRAEKIIFPRY